MEGGGGEEELEKGWREIEGCMDGSGDSVLEGSEGVVASDSEHDDSDQVV